MVRGGTARSEPSVPVFGREEVLDEVERTLRRARDGQGAVLLVTGPGGIGKSHVLRAAADRAELQGYRVLTGRAAPTEIPVPFSLVRELLGGSGGASRHRTVSLGPVTGLAMFVAPFETEPAPPEPGPEPASVAPMRDDLERLLAPVGPTHIEGLGAGREEMLGRLSEGFRELAREQPLLLAVDDLELADPPSIEFLRRLVNEFDQSPIALVATLGAVGEPSETDPTSLAALRRHPSVRSVVLRPLTMPEVTEFARWILGGHAPDPSDVTRWHAQTEGNPLFFEQLVRTVTGSSSRSAEPPSVERDLSAILLERTRNLALSDRRLLTYAAVLGKRFEFPCLAAVAGMGEERVTESLDRLVHQGLLRERGDEVYEFVTEGVRASVYAELTETRRRILHRKAGRALAMVGGVSDAELARQFYLGQDDPRAIEYNLRAAEGATRAFAFEAAVAHIARALESERRSASRDLRREIRLLTEEGRLLDELGSLPRAEAALAEAVELARAHPGAALELGRALLGLAQTRSEKSEYASAEALAREAMGILERVGTPRDLMAAHRVLGVVFWRRGDLVAAETHQRAALEIAEREGTPLERGHALVDVANTMVPLGETRFGPALELYGRAADLFATVEDHGARARVLMNRAVLEYSAGRTEGALRDMEVAVSAAERSRSPIWIGYCHLNLAQWLSELGRPVEARRALDRSVRTLGPIGDRLADQQIAMTRGQVAEAEGSLDEAEGHYQEALARGRELRLGSEVPEMLFRLAGLSSRRGELDEARARLAEAEKEGLLAHRPDLAARHESLARALRGAPSTPPA